MLKTLVSYVVAMALALLIIAPPLDYTIPLMVNSFHWCYLTIVCGLLGMYILSFNLHWALKCLAVYLFIGCFLSQIPYVSFNAYLLVVATYYLYLLLQHIDHKVLLKFLCAAFWLEAILTVFQLFGHDRLLNFDRQEPVFFGTVMQYMRFSSVLALMTPFLLLRNKFYLIPIVVLCILSQSMTFMMSLSALILTYTMLKYRGYRDILINTSICLLSAVVVYVLYDLDSVRGAILPENGGRLVSWWVALKTWVMDTSLAKPPLPLHGPFRLDWFLFGHGLDTFLPLFPVYKHDYNPFPQVHNDWLQFPWEIGLIGLILIITYAVNLSIRLYKQSRYDLLSGLACIATNMFFAFPTRMTQTMWLIVAYVAYCESQIGVSYAHTESDPGLIAGRLLGGGARGKSQAQTKVRPATTGSPIDDPFREQCNC